VVPRCITTAVDSVVVVVRYVVVRLIWFFPTLFLPLLLVTLVALRLCVRWLHLRGVTPLLRVVVIGVDYCCYLVPVGCCYCVFRCLPAVIGCYCIYCCSVTFVTLLR